MERRSFVACTCAAIALAGSWPSLPCEKCQEAALRELMMPWRPDDLPKADPSYLWERVSAITIPASGNSQGFRQQSAEVLPDNIAFVATVNGRTYYVPVDPGMKRSQRVFSALPAPRERADPGGT